jgi:NDP-4-keto-2,6-dideoxyhexose 3-C-methyltransferase
MSFITHCRSCKSEHLVSVVNLGSQYLSDFRDDTSKPPMHRLNLLYCEYCHLVQLDETTPSYEMYHDRYGFKSGINEAIKIDLKSNVETALKWVLTPHNWLDIASNDGTLLSYVPDGIHRVGIDPITKLCEDAIENDRAEEIINDFFDPDYFQDEEFDVITSISMFYDLNDPNEFVAGVASTLDFNGVWVIQQNYLLTMMEINAYDNICHEHLEYYSLHSLKPLLERHGLEILDVTLSDVNGGCIRTVVGHQGVRDSNDSVNIWLAKERAAGLNTVKAYTDFAKKVSKSVLETQDFVKDANARGKSVYIYGASTRGGTIWQACGLDVNDLPYAVERNPEKFGKVISSIGVPIISEEEARVMKPDYMLVSPWFFHDIFVEREKEYLENGGHLVFPLPNFEII